MKRLDLRAIRMPQFRQTATSCTRTAMIAVVMLVSGNSGVTAQDISWQADVRKRAADVEQKLIAWRRDIHRHPELGDQGNARRKL